MLQIMTTRHLVLTVALSAAVLAPDVARSAEPPSEETCGSEQTQTAMNTCFAALAQSLDDRANAEEARLISRLKDPEAVALLHKAHRAWADYVDAYCRFERSGVGGGTAAPMVYSICRIGLTRSYLEELAKQNNCPEGDLSCPTPK